MKPILVSALLLLLPASAAVAEEPGATVGIGSQGTLDGLYGAGVTWWRGRVAFAGMVGAYAADTDPWQHGVGGAATGYLEVLRGGGSRLAVGLRATAFRWSYGDVHFDHLALELPVRAEVALGPHFALFSELGFLLERLSGGGQPTVHVMGIAAPALTTTGFTYYF
jgi:hypothetical protein